MKLLVIFLELLKLVVLRCLNHREYALICCLVVMIVMICLLNALVLIDADLTTIRCMILYLMNDRASLML